MIEGGGKPYHTRIDKHRGRPQGHGLENSRGTQKEFWEESLMKPKKFFGQGCVRDSENL
jgi:hypothetical protein